MNPESFIIDRRSIICFKKTSFSGYALRDVTRDLATKLTAQNVHVAQHWAAELVCSGASAVFIETAIDVFCSSINVANPRFPGYLLQRIDELRNRLARLDVVDPLQARNDPTVRTIVCEVVGVMCLSNQKHAGAKTHIAEEDFYLDNITRRRRGPSSPPVLSVVRPGDPDECTIACGELYDAMLKRDSARTDYWLMWFWEWDTRKRRTTGANCCAVRPAPSLGLPPGKENSKLATDIVWLICDIIAYTASTLTPESAAAPRACLEMFRREFCATGSVVTRKRRFVLVQIAAQFVAERPATIPLIMNTNILSAMVAASNNLYTEIRKAGAALPTAGPPVGTTIGRTGAKTGGTGTKGKGRAKAKKEPDAATLASNAKLDQMFDFDPILGGGGGH